MKSIDPKTLPGTRVAIAALIPHQGAMCLLERVIHCDATHIECRSGSHQDAAHPLRSRGRIAAIHLCEYGAQAAAVHGALLGTQADRQAAPGWLVALREVRLAVTFLDECVALRAAANNDLVVRAKQLQAGPTGCTYEFAVSVNDLQLASGRATIMNAPPIASTAATP